MRLPAHFAIARARNPTASRGSSATFGHEEEVSMTSRQWLAVTSLVRSSLVKPPCQAR